MQKTLWLPDNKLPDLRSRIATVLQKRKVSLKELQQIVGHLNFACRVVIPGHAFLWQLCNAMKGLNRPMHRTRFTQGMKEDLEWNKFLAEFNGLTFWRGEIGLKSDF